MGPTGFQFVMVFLLVVVSNLVWGKTRFKLLNDKKKIKSLHKRKFGLINFVSFTTFKMNAYSYISKLF